MSRLLIVLFIGLLSVQNLEAQADSLLFVLRVDDIMSRNQTFVPKTLIPFQEMAESKGAVVSWGVMPHRFLEPNVNNGELRRDLLTSVANGHEISLHGYIHICQICNQSSHEMYCTTNNRAFTYQQQEKLILDGLKIIADSLGVRPTSFIPPGHVVDNTTFEVLTDHGFRSITIPGSPEFKTDKLYNIGTSNDFGWAITQANYVQRRTQALLDIRSQAASHGLYTLLLHDPFTRPGYLNGLLTQWTAEVLDSVVVEYGDYLRFVTISGAAEKFASSATSITRSDAIPTIIQLYQNYPNPFNPTTTISYEVSEIEPIRLMVYDVHGNLVQELVNGVHHPGRYQVNFDSANLASGVYIYKLESVNVQITRKMVLIK
jgi:peptidoglycan/xylan/chitin deacetylase (PgdA/CDA1 family)